MGAVALVCCVLVGFCDMILLGHPISGADASPGPGWEPREPTLQDAYHAALGNQATSAS